MNISIQQLMATFGAKYKRKESVGKSGRHFEVVGSPIPRKAMCDFFQSVVLARISDKVLDINSEVPSFGATCWQVGYAPHYSSVALAPNACGMARVLAMGTLSVVMIDIARVVRAAEALGTKITKLSDLKEFARSLTIDGYKKVKDAGSPFVAFKQTEETMLYVPIGWLVCEYGNGDPLIYGFRKSMFLDTAVEQKAYGVCANLMSADGLDVEKMRSVAKLFSCASTNSAEGVAAATQ